MPVELVAADYDEHVVSRFSEGDCQHLAIRKYKWMSVRATLALLCEYTSWLSVSVVECGGLLQNICL